MSWTTAQAPAGAFVIEETTGQKRKLRLVGRGLPYRPFTLTTKQRVEINWYPGNPIATSTILGATEEPTTIHGAWKDKFISSEGASIESLASGAVYPITLDDIPIGTVREAVTIVDDIVRAGQMLQVTWDEQVRHGHITEFEKSWQNFHDLDWTLGFSWISRGQAVVPAVVEQESPRRAASAISAANEDLRDAVNELAIPTSPEFQFDLLSLLDTIDGLVNEVLSAVATGVKLVNTPFAVIARITSLCTRVIGAAEDLIDFATSQVDGAFDFVTPLANQSFQKRLADGWYFRRIMQNSRKLQRVAVARRAQFLKQIDSDLLAVYTAKMGDDLRTVSQLYYGSPFDWRPLMIFNDLSGPQLSAGQVVMVPRQSGPQREPHAGSVGF
jgi:hypothetical protein